MITHHTFMALTYLSSIDQYIFDFDIEIPASRYNNNDILALSIKATN